MPYEAPEPFQNVYAIRHVAQCYADSLGKFYQNYNVAQEYLSGNAWAGDKYSLDYMEEMFGKAIVQERKDLWSEEMKSEIQEPIICLLPAAKDEVYPALVPILNWNLMERVNDILEDMNTGEETEESTENEHDDAGDHEEDGSLSDS